MAAGTASVLAPVAGAVVGGLTNKSKSPSTVSGYDMAPAASRERYKDTILPKADALLSQKFPAAPKQRAVNPAIDPFASQAMYDLQMYRDSNPVQPSQPTVSQDNIIDQYDELRGRMFFGEGQRGSAGVSSTPKKGFAGVNHGLDMALQYADRAGTLNNDVYQDVGAFTQLPYADQVGAVYGRPGDARDLYQSIISNIYGGAK